ncbi:MAG: M10 family metallopeptidase C-terminal domain-containing protein, partial [Pseudomonadota bacterium]
MPDIPGNSSTTTSITVDGAPVNDVLEFNSDRDWVRVSLTAGQKVTILVDGVTLDDAYLRVRDSFGNQLAENDDISLGSVRDSRLVFTAPSTGTYYLDIGSFNDTGTGTYQLTVKTYAPPVVVPVSEIANFLSDGYWGGDQHHFAVTQGGSISVNITALTTGGQTLARQALALWSDVTGISFNEVTVGGQMTFDDDEEGAFSESTYSGGITTRADVNVSTDWLNSHGFTTNTYSFQTYVHEIGHALGLGHSGYYNGDGNFATDAEFANDSWPITVMSYFDQQENSYFNNLGFSRAFAITPMIADIQAIATLYGLSTTTRTGDTTYGFGNNSGRSVYGPNFGTVVAYTVFDSGGIDTLDYSGFDQNQRISLISETFSNVGSGTGNVSIAFGTVIENATSGGGNDELIGNSANNRLESRVGNDVISGGSGNDTIIGGFGADILSGGAGSDIFRDTAMNMNGDTITDFTPGDAIIFSDATLAGFTFNLSGSTLAYTSGSLTLTGGVSSTLVASAASGGGVQLTISPLAIVPDVRNDFNGDGRSDILWRNDNGLLTDWLGQANGGFVDNGANAFASVATNWQVTGIGDFNGD